MDKVPKLLFFFLLCALQSFMIKVHSLKVKILFILSLLPFLNEKVIHASSQNFGRLSKMHLNRRGVMKVGV